MPSPTLRQRLRIRRAALHAAAIDSAAHALARVRYAMPDAHPKRFHVSVTRDVRYGPDGKSHHHLDVYVPARAMRPLPVVMYVHGGGFSMLSKDTHYVMAMSLARRGYLVFNINYRLGPKHVYPAPLEDASEALVWVQRNAARFGGDPSRIALAGESAGGNLVAALSLVTSKRFSEPFARRLFDANVAVRATVCTYPYLDMTDIGRYLAHPKIPFWAKGMLFDATCAYVGHDAFAPSGAALLASPLLVLEGGFVPERPLPPFFLSAGTRDPLLEHSRRLKSVLTTLGVESELLIAPGEIHGYDAMVWRKAAQEKWDRAHLFLARHMGEIAVADEPPALAG